MQLKLLNLFLSSLSLHSEGIFTSLVKPFFFSAAMQMLLIHFKNTPSVSTLTYLKLTNATNIDKPMHTFSICFSNRLTIFLWPSTT